MLLVCGVRMKRDRTAPDLGREFTLKVTQPFTSELLFLADASRQQPSNAEADHQVRQISPLGKIDT